jgi:hypothetical protein
MDWTTWKTIPDLLKEKSPSRIILGNCKGIRGLKKKAVSSSRTH